MHCVGDCDASQRYSLDDYGKNHSQIVLGDVHQTTTYKVIAIMKFLAINEMSILLSVLTDDILTKRTFKAHD